MPMTEPSKTVGARPAGIEDPQAAANAVREMFNTISPRYDLLNHVLSMNVDRLWWWRTARRFRHILRRSEAEVLDLCCGTGDMTFALYRQRRGSKAGITGADFAREMLCRAESKGKGTTIRWVEADALHMPFANETFDLVTSAFGFRNLADYDAGLREILRVLRPNGEIGILDFGEPKGTVGKVYRLYFKEVLPKVGTMISGVRGPYAYLPASVEKFPEPSEMLRRMRVAGFRETAYTPYTFGIAGLYWGRK
jgi:demethylmenaquinone methyltransferase / 2-methoxy-6-polyprenyl-1,4-benzoquinol methylase